jgi:3-oxoacyl-[acyl-carrier-protein] synthase II
MTANGVVVTGYAQVSALGLTLADFDQALLDARSGCQALDVALVGQDPFVAPVCASAFSQAGLIAPSKVPMDRATAMALSVAKAAVAHADLQLDTTERERLGVFWGSGMAGAHSFDNFSYALYVEHKRTRPTSVVTTMPNAPAAEISLFSQAQGASLSYACACASSSVAIGEALYAIKSGRIDVAIVGGSESMLTPAIVANWNAMRVLAAIKSDASQACRPFDAHRTGFALGEGAGALIIESQAHAQRRGARALGLLSGYATNCDGHHITQPQAAGQVRVMRQALHMAGLQPSDIGYINAHGTATSAGDWAEAQSVAEVFGERGVAVSSTKSLHGHLLGAGGVVELMVCLRALETGVLPSTLNCDELDPKMALDVIQGQARHVKGLRHAMSNSFAFGGTNAALIVSAV